MDDRSEDPVSEKDSRPDARLNRAHGVPMRLVPQSAALRSGAETERLKRALEQHFELVWRTLRRFGIATAAVDDAAQHVFLTLAAHLAHIAPGSERAFLVGACSRVAANTRRRQQRAPEPLDALDPVDDTGMTPEELLQWKQRREMLDRALSALSLEHRTVFVLFELEGFSLPEIAESLAIPLGTATSRLRRARLAFEAWVQQQQASGERS